VFSASKHGFNALDILLGTVWPSKKSTSEIWRSGLVALRCGMKRPPISPQTSEGSSLAVLARPNIVQQRFPNSKAWVSVIPFQNARESVMLLFKPFSPIPTSATLAAGIAHCCSICSNKVSPLEAGLRSTKSTSRRKGTVDDGDGSISDPIRTAGIIISIANTDERGYLRSRDFLIFLRSA
jgi:hypothetical protein